MSLAAASLCGVFAERGVVGVGIVPVVGVTPFGAITAKYGLEPCNV